VELAGVARGEGGPGPRDVLVVGRSAELLETLERLVRREGARAVQAGDHEGAGPGWEQAGLVLVEWSASAGPPLDPSAGRSTGRSAGRSRRPGVVLVCAGEPEPAVWRAAVELGAEHVAVLPDAQEWLAGRIRRVLSARPPGPVLAVVGGRGGAGASTLAASLALTAADRGLAVTLLDVDPLGGGLDLVLGAEGAPGLRWPDLRHAPGRLPAGVIAATAPRVARLSFVGWERTAPAEVAPQAVAAVIGSAAEDGDLVVVDLPRHVDDVSRAVLAVARTVYVVVPAEVRAAAAAARVVAALEPLAADLSLVVRGPAPTGLPAEAVADSLGLPLAGELKAEPGLPAALDRGDVPPMRPRGPLALLSARLVAAALS
jgi:secretion/DNA translocation related CpaE-like protein